MPDSANWFGLKDVYKKMFDPRTAITQQLEAMPPPAQTFQQSIDVGAQRQAIQQQLAQQALIADHQGLQPTLGPMGMGKAVGQMGFGLAAGPLAVGVGQDLGKSVQDFAKFQDPKALGLALGSLPLLIGMAASGTKVRSPLTAEAAQVIQTRMMENPKAIKLIQDMDPALGYEDLLRSLTNVSVDDMPAAINQFIKLRTIDLKKAEGGRAAAGPRTFSSLSDETKGTQHIAAKEATDPMAMFEGSVTDPNKWAKLDLTSTEGVGTKFRQYLNTTLAEATQRPAEKLKAINREVANDVMEQGIKSYNKWAKAEADRIKKEGLAETPPTTMTANFRLRDRYQSLLDQYFSSGNEPSRLRNDMVMPKNQTAYKAADPKLNKALQDLVDQGVQPYKTTFMRNSAIKKFFTGAVQELSNEEFMALLDMGVQSSAQKIIKLAEAKAKSKQR
jgi:hypothetical protein